jgi:NarL family two-component system response regulator YdfI
MRSLTEHEKDILLALADGERQHECAARMSCSYSTLRNNLQLIYAKLGANNAPHAIAIALRKGLIHLPLKKRGDKKEGHNDTGGSY